MFTIMIVIHLLFNSLTSLVLSVTLHFIAISGEELHEGKFKVRELCKFVTTSFHLVINLAV